MTASPATPSDHGLRTAFPATLLIALAALAAVAPLATDAYLPAFAQMADDLGVSASSVQLTMTTFLVGIALGQLGIGVLSDPEDVFDHLRREDGEHVGYIEMSADGRFIPYDRLWVRRSEAMELDEAEAVLDAIGLRLLAEDWLLEEDDLQTGEASWTRVRIREVHRDRVIVARAMEDLSAANVAKSVDLIGAIELPLPTTRLRSAS